jgi:hypothetical protein
MSHICEYCGTTFTRSYSLKQHQTKTKYCIALQQVQKYICEVCGKELSRKDSLRRHQESCRDYRKCKSDRMEEHMSHLTSLIEKILTQPQQPAAPTNVNNRNFVANLQPVVEEDIEAIALEYLTIDDLKKGVDGLVTFVLDYPLGKKIVCTDKSRKKIQYKDAEGHIVNDAGGVKLSQTFFKAINPRNQELIRNEYDEIHTKVQDIISRGAAHDENVAELMMEAMQIQTLAAKCEEIAQGGDNEVRTDFINRLAKQL